MLSSEDRNEIPQAGSDSPRATVHETVLPREAAFRAGLTNDIAGVHGDGGTLTRVDVEAMLLAQAQATWDVAYAAGRADERRAAVTMLNNLADLTAALPDDFYERHGLDSLIPREARVELTQAMARSIARGAHVARSAAP